MMNNYKALNYGRHKLADDDSIAAIGSDSVVTPRTMKGAWAGRCTLYARRGWIEDTERTSREAVFERDPDNRNRLNEDTPIRIIGNLIVDAQVLEFEA
jgi:phage tail sheath gpL-like